MAPNEPCWGLAGKRPGVGRFLGSFLGAGAVLTGHEPEGAAAYRSAGFSPQDRWEEDWRWEGEVAWRECLDLCGINPALRPE